MILLDTDVLVDVALDRRPYSGPASALLDRIEHGAEAAYIAWHSLSNLYYVVGPCSKSPDSGRLLEQARVLMQKWGGRKKAGGSFV